MPVVQKPFEGGKRLDADVMLDAFCVRSRG